MANNGWIWLHRSIINWEWYQDANTMRVFVHILLSANHSPGEWKGQSVQRGEFITGRKVLARELNLSERQIRTSLKRLKSTKEITIKSTSQYSIITIVNYNKYQTDKNPNDQQNDQQIDQQVTSKRPANDQQVTTNKKNKKENNEKKEKNNNIYTPGQRPGTNQELDNVWLSDDEVLNLKTRFTNGLYQRLITDLDSYIENNPKGRKYKNHYKVLITWGNKRVDEQKTQAAAAYQKPRHKMTTDELNPEIAELFYGRKH